LVAIRIKSESRDLVKSIGNSNQISQNEGLLSVESGAMVKSGRSQV
jgi:hypothetical protein